MSHTTTFFYCIDAQHLTCLTTAMPGTIWWMFFFQQRILLWLLLYYCNSFYSPSRIIPVSIVYSYPPIVFAALCLPLRKFFTMFISNPDFDCISIRFRNVHLFSPCWIDCFRIVLTENLCAITAPTVYPLAQCVIIYSIYTTKKCILKIL